MQYNVEFYKCRNRFQTFYQKNLPVAIYHAFDTKITDIVQSLDRIQEHGYSHIQTSPLQKSKILTKNNINPNLIKGLIEENKIKSPDELLIKNFWWLQYQPVSTEIGNALGTIAELMVLIDQAAKKNLGIVMDIVVNHLESINVEGDWIEFQKSFCNQKFASQHDTFKKCYDEFIINIHHLEPLKKEIYLKMLNELKKIIKNFLQVDDWNDDYWNVIEPPYDCNDRRWSWKCWLNNALSQLNHDNVLVRNKIIGLCEKYADLGIAGLRFDAAGHIKPQWIKYYIDIFNDRIKTNQNNFKYGKKLSNILKHPYCYAEVIETNGYEYVYNNDEYSKIIPITDYLIVPILKKIFEYGNDYKQLELFYLPSGQCDSVVFSSTHDTELIDGSITLPDFVISNYVDNILLAAVYFLQRIYNVPLIYISQSYDQRIQIACLFRKHMKFKEVDAEETCVNNLVLVSTKKK